jgi:putative RNA 2'-phosphotransferase
MKASDAERCEAGAAAIVHAISGVRIQMTDDPVRLSKFISYVLRHKPDSIGLTLDSQGWASIDELIEKSNASGTMFGRVDLLKMVDDNDKKRFSVSNDRQRIRAAQGHSITVELGLMAQEPPHVLYHGTATRFVGSILAEGLKPQSRQQVHLSADETTAHRVGQRHGKPAILTVEAHLMHAEGFQFFLADNGVWLTDHVPPAFLGLTSPSTTK